MVRTYSKLALIACALALASCRRETAGQTGVLLTLQTRGPCDCVTLREAVADAGAALAQSIDQAGGLPEAFRNGGWKQAELTALVYAGGQLGDAALTILAEGHRGSCAGPVVSRAVIPATFSPGQIVPAQGTLQLLGPDQDGDGYAAGEDCNDADPSVHPGAPKSCDGKDQACDGHPRTCANDPSCAGQECDGNGGTCKASVCVAACSGPGPADCNDPRCKGKRCAGSGVCTIDKKCVIEICNNGVDDNGDGLADCQDALACPAPGGLARPLCCGTGWVDAATDVHHCGACATDCAAGHSSQCGTIACAAGQCVYGSVADGQSCSAGKCCKGSCDSLAGMTTPRCCSAGYVDVDHGDPQNCGSCGHVCPGADACHAAVCLPGGSCGLVTLCNNASCMGVACRDGSGKPGVCSQTQCCTGCVAQDGSCHAGTSNDDLHACIGSGSACVDCQPGAPNACVLDQCTAQGCTHTPQTGASCTDASNRAGKCTAQGQCCSGCVDQSGVCQPIDATHCGTPGGQCQALSCDDGNACTADSCSAAGTCQHAPRDRQTCPGGVCAGSACCQGCIDATSDACLAGTTVLACGAAGAQCSQCPQPASICQAAACSGGGCGTTPAHEGLACPLGDGGTGVCQAGACRANCADGRVPCNGVCCGAGDSCSAGVCQCDTGSSAAGCAQQATPGCCSSASPSHCLPPGFDNCALCSNGKNLFCSSCAGSGDRGTGCDTTGSCVSSCGSCGGGNYTVNCTGQECLKPGDDGAGTGEGASGRLNICSAPAKPFSCAPAGAASTACACDENANGGAGDPSTCPGPANTVCRSSSRTRPAECFPCTQGFTSTDLQKCKDGKTCHADTGTCR